MSKTDTAIGNNPEKHASVVATQFAALERAHGKVVEKLSDYIHQCNISEASIEKFLGEWSDKCGDRVTAGSKKVYKSQMKKVLTLAIKNKEEVLKHGKQAGNLNQWYQLCLGNQPPQRNQNPTVKGKKPEPQVAELPPVEETVTNPLDNFESAVASMIAAGMTAKEIHDKVDAIITLSTAQAA